MKDAKKESAPWPHAPPHRLDAAGTFFVTGSTYQKQFFFHGKKRLAVLHRGLLTLADQYGWQLEAWAVFSNHYHFVARSPVADSGATSLRPMLKTLHVQTAGWVNRLDDQQGRKVWYQFRETRLTFEKSYLARLKYVHQNAVHHGLVPIANQYPWCSAGWFERIASDVRWQVFRCQGFLELNKNLTDCYS